MTEDAIWIVGPGTKQRPGPIAKNHQQQQLSDAHPIIIEFKNVHDVSQLERRHAPNRGHTPSHPSTLISLLIYIVLF